MLAATEQAGADLLHIAQEIGKELILRYPEALGTLRLGVLRIEKHVRPGSIELDMPTDRKGGDAAPTDQPKAEQGQDEAITILDLSPLVAVTGKVSASSISSMPKSRVCQGGTSRSKRSSGVARAARRRLDRGQPSPVALSVRSGVRRSRDCRRHGHRGRPYLGG